VTYQEALIAKGWEFKGNCGGCSSKLESWKHSEKPDEEIKVSSRAGYFYHYKGKFCIKADYKEKLSNY